MNLSEFKSLVGSEQCVIYNQLIEKRSSHQHLMLTRCYRDVEINILTYEALLKEAEDNAINGSWDKSLELAQQTFYAMEKQTRTGVPFNEAKACKLVERIDGMMKEIEEEVEPQLPMRRLPDSKQPTFPSKPFKEDGSLSNAGWNWIKRLGYDVNEEAINHPKIPANPFKQCGTLSVNGGKWFIKEGVITDTDDLSVDNLELCRQYIKSIIASSASSQALTEGDMNDALQDIRDKKQIILEEPMTLSNQDDLKKWLVKQGWKPTLWRTKNSTVDSKKKARTEVETLQIIKDYIVATRRSPYKYFIMKELGINFDKLSDSKLVDKLLRKARFLPTTPQFKDERGELCPHLEKLNGELAKSVVKWLSLRNRRGVLKAFDEKKKSGWLNHPRLKVDGRLPAGSSGLANTLRQKHRTVTNVPKADPKVLLGKEMRELFYAESGYVMLGWDGEALEARIGGWYAEVYGGDGGEYGRKVLGIGGLDFHQENAVAYTKAAGVTITRSSGKNVTYGITYGAQAAKLAKMLGISLDKAKAILNAFWDTNKGLKVLRERLEVYWGATGNKYIKGIDGSKIYTRSRHSLLNCLFQSCGALVMNLAIEKLRVAMRDEGIIGTERNVFMHDEIQHLIPMKQVEFKTFSDKESAETFSDGRIWSDVRELDSGAFARYYHRVGELAAMKMIEAGEELGSPIEITASYCVGRNWSETH